MNKPRLIDANALIEHIVNTPSKVMNEIPYEPTMFTNIQNRVNEILDAIEKQPTAYDIDEIVEKLEKAVKIYRDKAVIELSTEGHTLDYEHFEGKSKAFLNAIEIVKGGAV